MMMVLMFFFGLFIFYMRFKMKHFVSNFFFLISLYFITRFSNLDWFNYSCGLSLNKYSYYMVILTFFMMGMVLKIIDENNNEVYCVLLNMFLTLVLYLTFVSTSILMYYFFFEVSLLIMYSMMLKWGIGPMRLVSAFYLLFYTLFFSLPLLVFIMHGVEMAYSSNMMIMEKSNLYMNKYMFIYMFMTFMVKIPMYSFHGWLLKAHVEAPIFGSMVLASIMLKLGTYGVLRFMMIFTKNFYEILDLLLIFSILGGVLSAMICLYQIDMKVLVAYSSVVHMSILISGLLTFMSIGMIGCYYIMVSHGLCSSGLFYLVNIIYSETNSRLMLLNKGMMKIMPSMSLMWFMLCSSNMSSPVSLNLVGEIFLLMSLIIWLKIFFIILIFYCFFAFIYSLYFFSYIQHGDLNFYIFTSPGNLLNYFILLMHWIPLNFMFLNLFMFMMS